MDAITHVACVGSCCAQAWAPPEKRSRSLSLIYSGHQIGSIVSLLLSPIIIAGTGVVQDMCGAGHVWSRIGVEAAQVWPSCRTCVEQKRCEAGQLLTESCGAGLEWARIYVRVA